MIFSLLSTTLYLGLLALTFSGLVVFTTKVSDYFASSLSSFELFGGYFAVIYTFLPATVEAFNQSLFFVIFLIGAVILFRLNVWILNSVRGSGGEV